MPDQITIVYSVVDEAAFQAGGNPLRYEHHGLKAHTVSIHDEFERAAKLRAKLEEVRDELSPSQRISVDDLLKSL